MTALQLVQKFYPSVNKIYDGSKDLDLTVTSKDVSSGKRKKHPECALAVSCKRNYATKGIIVALSKAYVITDKNEAIRYDVSASARTEIVAFDRNGEFSPGEYVFKAPKGSQKLGVRPFRTNPDKSSKGKHKNKYRHVTQDVRSLYQPE